MIETTGSEAATLFGFDPDAVFPNRDFWCIEEGRLHVVMPPPPEALSDEERALLESVTVDPSVYPNYLGACDAEGGCTEHVFVQPGADRTLVPLKTDEPTANLRPWYARALAAVFGTSWLRS